MAGGPCFEIDFNTRAAGAGYNCVWVCGAYVHRFPRSEGVIRRESELFRRNKQLYQLKFCRLQLQGQRAEFCEHCRAEACEHFGPPTPVKNRGAGAVAEHDARCRQRPLVSCIMPTYNRRPFISRAIKYFLYQDYPHKELIIVDDGTDRVADLVPDDIRIRYIPLQQRASIGAKRNLAVEQSRGEIVVHWDDDDWYGKNRISYQVQPLIEGRADLCGLDTGCIYNIVENTFWSYEPRLHASMFYADIHGGSIVYAKHLWERHGKYPDINLAEDAAFLRLLAGKARIAKLPNRDVFIYIRHDHNAWEFICGKFIDPSAWKCVPRPSFLQDEDIRFYRHVSAKL
jgi:hypothetical protein